MTNKIIAQSARFRAVRTSRDRVRIKSADGKTEVASIKRTETVFGIHWVTSFDPRCLPKGDGTRNNLTTFCDAVVLSLEKEAK